MTDFANFTAQIAEWCNRQDWSPTLVTLFVRTAEQKLNQELRVSRMIKMATNTITCRCSTLPDDWLEMEFVSVANMNDQGQAANDNPNGWRPIRYLPRDEFFDLSDEHTQRFYTLEGRVITFGGPPNATEGVQTQIYYFAEVPVFSDTCDSWVYTKYPALYLHASLIEAYLHAIGEEQQAIGAKQLAEDMIGKLNAEYRYSKASGSRLGRPRHRSFG